MTFREKYGDLTLPEFSKENMLRAETHPTRLDDQTAEKIIAEKIDMAALKEALGEHSFDNVPGALEALARLTLELKEDLASYNTIISDDASARVLSLYFYKLINTKRKDAQEAAAKIYFIAGGEQTQGVDIRRSSAFEDFISKHKANWKKVLVVTEYIDTGRGMMAMATPLEEAGVDFTIATASVSEDLYIPRADGEYNYKPVLRRHTVYGQIGDAGLAFYKEDFNGVWKNEESPNLHPEESVSMFTDEIHAARQEITIIADEFKKLVN